MRARWPWTHVFSQLVGVCDAVCAVQVLPQLERCQLGAVAAVEGALLPPVSQPAKPASEPVQPASQSYFDQLEGVGTYLPTYTKFHGSPHSSYAIGMLHLKYASYINQLFQ